MHVTLPVPMRLIDTAPYAELRAFRDGLVELSSWIQPSQRTDRDPVEWTICRTGQTLTFKPPLLSSESRVSGGVDRFCKKFLTEVVRTQLARVDHIDIAADTIVISVLDPNTEGGQGIHLRYYEVLRVCTIVDMAETTSLTAGVDGGGGEDAGGGEGSGGGRSVTRGREDGGGGRGANGRGGSNGTEGRGRGEVELRARGRGGRG